MARPKRMGGRVAFYVPPGVQEQVTEPPPRSESPGLEETTAQPSAALLVQRHAARLTVTLHWGCAERCRPMAPLLSKLELSHETLRLRQARRRPRAAARAPA